MDEEVRRLYGVGRPRAWSCIVMPDQPRRRGQYAAAFFHFRVLLHRCLHKTKRFPGPQHLQRRCATSEKLHGDAQRSIRPDQ